MSMKKFTPEYRGVVQVSVHIESYFLLVHI